MARIKTVSANKPLVIKVDPKHWKRYVPGKPFVCPASKAAMEQHPFEFFAVYRYTTIGRYKGENEITKWQNTAAATKFAISMDLKDTTKYHGPLTLRFIPPRRAVSPEYLRSGSRKKVAKASRERRKGKTRRKYTYPDPLTLAGVRNRFGHQVDT